ncbi:hypothetical protein [Luteimonas sp. A478]
MRLSAFAFLVTASAFALPSLATMRDCPTHADPPATVCRAAVHGWAYAPDEASAARAAEALDAAASDFQRHLGRIPPRGALVLSKSFDQEASTRFSEEFGLGYVQVWLDAAVQRAMLERTLRQAMPDIDDAKLEAVLDTQGGEGHANTLRHELGHSMFAATFWPQDQAAPEERYGSPAPDWLDEAAAMLMEADLYRGRHEAAFLEVLRTTPEHISPVSEFVQMEHPMTADARAALLAGGGQESDSGVQVMASSGPDSTRVTRFYGQSIMFANFLIESSRDTGILGPISAALAEGSTFAGWLENSGPQHGLPASIERLETAWDAWCQRRLAQVGTAAGG